MNDSQPNAEMGIPLSYLMTATKMRPANLENPANQETLRQLESLGIGVHMIGTDQFYENLLVIAGLSDQSTQILMACHNGTGRSRMVKALAYEINAPVALSQKELAKGDRLVDDLYIGKAASDINGLLISSQVINGRLQPRGYTLPINNLFIFASKPDDIGDLRALPATFQMLKDQQGVSSFNFDITVVIGDESAHDTKIRAFRASQTFKN